MDHGKDDKLVFSAEEIREKGGLSASLTLEPALFAETLEPPARVVKASANLVFTVADEGIVLTGEVQASISFECARCGAVFTSCLSEAFDEAYEDAVESIDVSGPLAESVALMPPLKPLCAETCKGLCAICGCDLNRKTCGCTGKLEEEFERARKRAPFDALKDLPGQRQDEKKDGRKKRPGTDI